MAKKLDLVNALKGFSIFTIVLMHLLQGYAEGILYKALSLGGAGVHVFLLCSGFGLYLSQLNKPLSYNSFLKRRTIRVYLPYVIIILISALIPFYCLSSEKWMYVASHLFLFKMFVEKYEYSMGGQMWFISTIIQFYLFWPLLVKAFKWLSNKQKYLPLIVGLVISTMWATLVVILHKESLRIWNSFFLQYLWEFMLGMFLAQCYKKNPNSLKTPKLWKLLFLRILGLSISGITGIIGGVWKVYNDVPSMIGYLCMGIIVCKAPLANKFFSFTNHLSYEWYLVHILVFKIIDHYIHLHLLMHLIICFLTSYIIAYIYSIVLKKAHLK